MMSSEGLDSLVAVARSGADADRLDSTRPHREFLAAPRFKRGP